MRARSPKGLLGQKYGMEMLTDAQNFILRGKKGHKTEIDPPVLRRFDLLLPSLSMGIDWLIHHLWVIKLIGSVSSRTSI